MNKQNLIENLARTTGQTKTQAEAFLNATVKLVRTSVRKGDDVKISGFGTFTKSKRRARIGRNPQTGKEIKVPSAWYPKFRAGAEFKSEIKG